MLTSISPQLNSFLLLLPSLLMIAKKDFDIVDFQAGVLKKSCTSAVPPTSALESNPLTLSSQLDTTSMKVR